MVVKSVLAHYCPICKNIIRAIPFESLTEHFDKQILTDEVCGDCLPLLNEQLLLVHPPSGVAVLVNLEAFEKLNLSGYPVYPVPKSRVLAVSLKTCQLLLEKLCEDKHIETDK